jgi:hypothetical protein
MDDAAHTAPEIVIVVSQMHPRVCYAMETILGEFLGLRPCLVLENDAEAIAAALSAGLPIFIYCIRSAEPTLPPSDPFIHLPCNGLLYEDIIRQANAQIDWFGAVSGQMKLADHIAQIFYHLSQYALLRPAARVALDAHGRYPDGDGHLVVHQLLAALRQMLAPHITHFPSGPAFDYEITIDVDQPWKYLHKPWHVRWGGWLRARLQGTDHRERWQALRSGKDPFDLLPIIQELCPAAKTKVFFLVGGDHPNDSRFDISQAAYQKYVLAYQQAGYELGIHPSYEAVDRPELMPAQKAALEAVIGPVCISRQHYLRYRTPDTLRALAAAGIVRDYTVCLSAGTGAPTGVALPYRWYDLQRNVATALRLVPAMVMDRTLLQYMQLDPAQAIAEIAAQIAQTRAVGGRFVIILHNETFSDVGEWKGWLAVIHKMMQLLQA